MGTGLRWGEESANALEQPYMGIQRLSKVKGQKNKGKMTRAQYQRLSKMKRVSNGWSVEHDNQYYSWVRTSDRGGR